MKTKVLILTLTVFLLSSCGLYKTSSRFVTDILPGITKKEFVRKYGEPFSRNVSYDENHVLHETLFYKELLFINTGVATTTAFHFKDGILINQELVKEEIPSSSCSCIK